MRHRQSSCSCRITDPPRPMMAPARALVMSTRNSTSRPPPLAAAVAGRLAAAPAAADASSSSSASSPRARLWPVSLGAAAGASSAAPVAAASSAAAVSVAASAGSPSVMFAAPRVVYTHRAKNPSRAQLDAHRLPRGLPPMADAEDGDALVVEVSEQPLDVAFHPREQLVVAGAHRRRRERRASRAGRAAAPPVPAQQTGGNHVSVSCPPPRPAARSHHRGLHRARAVHGHRRGRRHPTPTARRVLSRRELRPAGARFH